VPLQGKEVKHKVLVVNQQMFQHLQKEKKQWVVVSWLKDKEWA
jgi:hypothetical protein